MSRSASASNSTQANELIARLNGRPVVLIGMMGAGKSTVGRKLAARLGRKFIDCDKEIEAAANMSIPDFFATHGEAEFRAGEQRVISRILKDPDTVVATGGGAFMSEETRDLIAEQAVSVWINADADLLLARVSRRSNRPLLNTADPRVTLQKLIDERYPVYALANVTVTSRDVPQDAVAADIVGLLLDWTLTGSSPSQEAGQTADAR